MRKFVVSLGAAMALASASCSTKSYPVSGKVMYMGAPASGAVVFFYHQGGNEPALMATVQADGSFELTRGSMGIGAPAGDYDVLVQWSPITNQENGRPQRGPDKLKGRYADLKRPLLHAKVLPETTELPPFELTFLGPVKKR